MSEHSVIYLSPSDDPEREWCQDDVWEESVRYNLGTDFDAQRLRADTAEAALAERDEALRLKQRDFIEAQTAVTGWARKHAAAEQRIAKLKGLLEESLGSVYVEAKRAEFASRLLLGLADRVEAALNPNPEAESHE